MGRFYAGWVEAKLKGKPGSLIAVSHSYNKDVDCQYNQRNEYVLGANGGGTSCDHFSCHGCRFVTIDGVDEPPALADIVGYRIGNDLNRVGSFDCSNKLFKRIYDVDLNTCLNLTTGGFMVDCPHRERLGYGDTCQTSLEAMAANFDAGAFYTKWANDWHDIQQDNGYVAHTAPQTDGGGGPCWSGSAMMIPWGVFQFYGDRRILEIAYPHTKRWLAFLQTKCDADGLLRPFTPPAGTPYPQWSFIGDWVTPHGSELSDSVEALYFNNCYYLLAMRTAAQIARVLGLDEDARNYETRAERIKSALNKRFFNASQNIYLDTRQSRAVMALVSGSVPNDGLAAVMANLRNEILVGQKGHLDVGDPVIYYMTKYLTEHDANDLVFTYMNQTTYPGYGFFIGKDLDTWPETWDAQGPDSSIIHGCFTGISRWFLSGIAGIRPDPATPGFKHFLLKPAVVGDLTWTDATCNSPYGPIGCKWSIGGNRLTVKVKIPSNTTATVHVPARDVSVVTESGKPANSSPDVKFLRMENGCAVFHVQSGTYEFAASTSKP
jgi:alpha-L-rhamnosidase